MKEYYTAWWHPRDGQGEVQNGTDEDRPPVQKTRRATVEKISSVTKFTMESRKPSVLRFSTLLYEVCRSSLNTGSLKGAKFVSS